jgi:hypothetical protein
MAGQIRRVHEYTVDREGGEGPGVAKIVSVNPLVRFVSAMHPPIVWQDDRWMDDSGRLIDVATVPEGYLKEVEKRKALRRPADRVPDTLVRCDFCDRFDIPSSQYAQHLIEAHVPKQPEDPEQPATPAIEAAQAVKSARRKGTVVQTAGA